MKKYTVTWHHSAQDSLAKIYLQDPDPSAVTRAADQIDRHLAHNPSFQVIPIEGGCFELTIGALSVVFRIREDDRIVEVLRVARV